MRGARASASDAAAAALERTCAGLRELRTRTGVYGESLLRGEEYYVPYVFGMSRNGPQLVPPKFRIAALAHAPAR
jgi:hypothetical protein